MGDKTRGSAKDGGVLAYETHLKTTTMTTTMTTTTMTTTPYYTQNRPFIYTPRLAKSKRHATMECTAYVTMTTV